MNIVIKQSLIAASLLASISTQSFAADTLVDAFKNAKVKGELKSYYFNEDYDSADADNDIWVNGGTLNYQTDRFYGFKLGATVQAASVTEIDDDASKQNNTMNASGAVVSESYLSYKYKNTEFKGGRQYIALPLIKGSSTRFIKESFEAYMLTNTDIPDTLISLGKVTKYQTRTDNKSGSFTNAVSFHNNNTTVGNIGDFYDIGKDGDGAISLYIKNKSVKGLALQVHYVDFLDEVVDLYADGVYTYKFSEDFKPFVAVQYYGSDYDDSATQDSFMMGYKIGAEVFKTKIHASYTSTDDDGNVNRGIGESATAAFTSSATTSGNYTAGTDSWQVCATKKFGNLSTKVSYTDSDAQIDTADLTQTYFKLAYNFSGALKNLGLSAEYTIYNYGKDSKDKNELRTKLIYKF